MDASYYAKGNRVVSTRWDTIGTVLRADDEYVYVQWDGTSFDDRTDPREIRPL